MPVALLVGLSLAREWRYPALLPRNWDPQLWLDILSSDSGIPEAILTSGAIAVVVSVLATGGGFLLSRRVAQHRWSRGLAVVAHLPFAVSPVIVGVTLLFVFIRLGLAETMLGVVLAQLPFALGYAVLLLRGFWNDQAVNFGGMARTLGATPEQVWLRVFMPRAAGLLGVCAFQTYLISWFDYPLVLLIGGGKVQTLTLKLFEYFGSGDVRLASACGLLLMLPPLIVLFARRSALQLRFAGAMEERRV